MIIDGHAHACGDFCTARHLIDTLDEHAVDRVVLVPGEPDSTRTYPLPELARLFPDRDVVPITNALSRMALRFAKTVETIPDGNRSVAALAQAYPDRILPFLWVLISRPGMVETIAAQFAEGNYRGIKLHQCWETFSVQSEGFAQVARFAAQQDVPIFIHLGSYREVEALIAWIRDHPATKLIIGHLFGLERFIQSGIPMEHVYFDISNTYLVSTQRVLRAIRHFGAQRVTLGSDTPYGRNSLGRNIARVRALPISEAEKEMILGRNLQALLHL